MNQIDQHTHLRAAVEAGARIQAWHLTGERRTSAEGEWETIDFPQFSCPAHLYRVHPDDLHKAPHIGIPEGWALVPQRMSISPKDLANIEFLCGGDRESQEDDERWLDGILWVGETEGDHGEKYWGLNIACVDVLEEGSLPIVEFERPAGSGVVQ